MNESQRALVENFPKADRGVYDESEQKGVVEEDFVVAAVKRTLGKQAEMKVKRK
jgi:hypothetical protein